MLKRPLAFAVILVAATIWRSPDVAARPSRQTQSPWVQTESRRFEIHYQRTLGSELDRVVRIAEKAYDQVSRRLDFVLATKVPLIIFAPSGPMTREQAVEYATGDQVAPPQPHRSRIVLPLSDDNAQLNTQLVHELTHLLAFEIILPHRAGDGGLPRWVSEGLATHMVGIWSDDDTRVMRELVASGQIPALSELTGRGEFATAHLSDAIGHAAFDYIESRWGATSIRSFLNALIVPRVDKTYDAVFELTPAEFDAAFRQYAERQFKPAPR
jgi:hypothetical protein